MARTADRAIVVELPQKERSPGIRTYQASLLGLLLVAIQLGEMQARQSQPEADALRQELVALADVVDATNAAVKEPCQEVAEAVATAPTLVMLGSGPSYGTALFSAAKMVEAAGIFAMGQDLEEWWHVERFAYPVDMPVFVLAPPGRSHWRAGEVAATARGLGRRVIAVAPRTIARSPAMPTPCYPCRARRARSFRPWSTMCLPAMWLRPWPSVWGAACSRATGPNCSARSTSTTPACCL